MARESLMMSFINNLIPWFFKVTNWRDYQELTSNLDDGNITGSFRMTNISQRQDFMG